MTDPIKAAIEALEPIAALADIFDFKGGNRPTEGLVANWADHRVGSRDLTVEMLRRARTALDSLKAMEPVDRDYFGTLVDRARQAAAKASAKFPQPNYVALKIAEEAGEVVRGAVHYAEDRMKWEEVEGEVVQLLAMLIRFVTEGDQVNGIRPPLWTRDRALPQPEGGDNG